MCSPVRLCLESGLTVLRSHDINSHLLSRSEVVALINTLHRLTESLHFVNDFRRMWAEADAEFSKELIREADVAVSGTVCLVFFRICCLLVDCDIA